MSDKRRFDDVEILKSDEFKDWYTNIYMKDNIPSMGAIFLTDAEPYLALTKFKEYKRERK